MASPTTLRKIPSGSNFSRTALKRAICCKQISASWPQPSVNNLTSGSRFLAERSNTSLVFLVQCGRHGNSSMSVSASLWSVILSTATLSTDSLYQLTKRFVVPQPITNTRFIRWKIQHNSTFIPISAIGGTVGDLTEKVEIRSAKLDIDAASIGRCHKLELLGFVVEKLTNPLEHCIRLSHGKRKL